MSNAPLKAVNFISSEQNASYCSVDVKILHFSQLPDSRVFPPSHLTEAKVKRVFVYFMASNAKLFETRRIDSNGQRRRRRRPDNFPAGLYRATLKTLPERFYQAKTNSVERTPGRE